MRALLEVSGGELAQMQADFEGQGRLGSAEAWWSRMAQEDGPRRAERPVDSADSAFLWGVFLNLAPGGPWIQGMSTNHG